MNADERSIEGSRDQSHRPSAVGHRSSARNTDSRQPTADSRLLDPSLLAVHDLGRMTYAEAFAMQKQLQQEVIARRDEAVEPCRRALGYILLVEHDPPVITVSRRKTARQHLIATPEQLARAGVEVAETDRGGDITYHGPGQLVVYPIVDLNMLGLRMHGYMRLLEQTVIETLAHFGIVAERDATATGVWVRPGQRADGMESTGIDFAKICAMGVRVSRWVTMHGLALNVTTNLQHFQLIVPCGLAGRQVTSMAELLGEDCPSMDQVKRVLVDRFQCAAQQCCAGYS